jgi:hypothetical protein
MRTAAVVAKHKEHHPELYCQQKQCLWRTGGGFCPRHKPTKSNDPVWNDPVWDYTQCRCANNGDLCEYCLTMEKSQ